MNHTQSLINWLAAFRQPAKLAQRVVPISDSRGTLRESRPGYSLTVELVPDGRGLVALKMETSEGYWYADRIPADMIPGQLQPRIENALLRITEKLLAGERRF